MQAMSSVNGALQSQLCQQGQVLKMHDSRGKPDPVQSITGGRTVQQTI